MKDLMRTESSDEQLVNQYLNGDNNCFGVLYSRYYSKVYAKCYSFSGNGDDAFDMAQEILLKAIGKVGSFEGNSKFSTWLYAISVNYCISQSNKKSRKYHDDIMAAQQIMAERMDEGDFEARVRREEMEEKIDDYLLLLSEEERQLLILKYKKNYSIKELQIKLDLSASAVKMRLLRARMKMSQLIGIQEAA